MSLQSFNARTGQAVGAALPESSAADIDSAVQAAAQAFVTWSSSTGGERAALLRALASGLEAQREVLVPLADEETALGPIRLNGELDRTAFQLRRFADIAERGQPFAFTDDPAVPGAPPAGHPALVRQRVPLGPVAMFAASNFPFAFSVLGGDSASALAAGCTLVVKAHPGHPRLSQQVFGMIQTVLQAQGLPAGVITLVQGASIDVGVTLIRHPLIAAGAFTGSTRGGAALQAQANARPRAIPFYGELGSVNPIVALPHMLATKGEELANGLAASIAMGCGQFCTSPGIIVLLDNDASRAGNDLFVGHLTTALKAQQPHAMLTVGMRRALDASIAQNLKAGVAPLLHEPVDTTAPRPFLGQVDAKTFMAEKVLHDEVFGPASLVVRCASIAQIVAVLETIAGSLTVTLWGADEDTVDNRALVRAATLIAGRVLFAGVPTGVAVSAGQQHGGPWPSSSQPMTTSVGDAALDRFLRPVALQDAPSWLLQRQGRPC